MLESKHNTFYLCENSIFFRNFQTGTGAVFGGRGLKELQED
jgi:hypothetical protein